MDDDRGDGRRFFLRDVRTNGKLTGASGSSKSDLEATAETIASSNRFHRECRGSVGISTGSGMNNLTCSTQVNWNKR